MVEAATEEVIAPEVADAHMKDVPDMMKCYTDLDPEEEKVMRTKLESHLRTADIHRERGRSVVRKAFQKSDPSKTAVGFAIWQAMSVFHARPLLRGHYFPTYDLKDTDWGRPSPECAKTEN